MLTSFDERYLATWVYVNGMENRFYHPSEISRINVAEGTRGCVCCVLTTWGCEMLFLAGDLCADRVVRSRLRLSQAGLP